MLRRVLRALALTDRDSRSWMVAYIVVSTMAAGLEAGGIGMVYLFFQVALNPDTFGGVELIATLHREMGAPPINSFLAEFSLAVVVIFVLRSILLIANSWQAPALRKQIQMSMSDKLFRTYLAYPWVWHAGRSNSKLVNNVVINLGMVSLSLVVSALNLIAAVIMAAGLIVAMLILRPLETVVAAGLTLGLSFVYLVLFHRPLARWGAVTVRANERLLRSVREALTGIKTVKVYRLEQHFRSLVENDLRDYLDMFVRQSVSQQAPRFVLEALLLGGVLVAVAAALNSGQSPTSIIPTMALFTAAAVRLLPQIVRVLQMVQIIRFTQASLGDIEEDLRAAVPENPRPVAPVAKVPFQSLSLRGITFRYSGAERAALRGIDLEIRRGERIALVGLSGAGKTTLADLLLGLMPPDAGGILLNGQALIGIPPSLFSYVPQEPFLVHQTLRRNIALGRADAEIDEEAVHRAIERAALAPVVARLPRGLDTVIGEDGGGLSGGEKQRLGLARALYEDADIMVLDEPTSALDAKTEDLVSQTIRSFGTEKTVIMVAHRLSTIRHFDRIVFLEGGTIVASGRFDPLYHECPSFKAMVDFLSVAPVQTAAEAGRARA